MFGSQDEPTSISSIGERTLPTVLDLEGDHSKEELDFDLLNVSYAAVTAFSEIAMAVCSAQAAIGKATPIPIITRYILCLQHLLA